MVENENRREEFIKENLGLVRSLVSRFTGKGIEYEDLYQTGCIGLIKAYDAFDETRGFCFSTYAVPVILGELKRLFRDGGAVKVSRSVKELGMKIAAEKNRFLLKYGREPTVGELSEILGVAAEDITEAVCAARPAVSLTLSDDGIKESEIPVFDNENELNDRITLAEAFAKLDQKERELISHRYFEFLTQHKTAQKLGMTQVQVSRSEKKILIKLREML